MDGVEVLIFRPKPMSGLLPGIMLFHGGGWVLGTPGLCFFTIRRRCNICDFKRL